MTRSNKIVVAVCMFVLLLAAYLVFKTSFTTKGPSRLEPVPGKNAAIDSDTRRISPIVQQSYLTDDSEKSDKDQSNVVSYDIVVTGLNIR